MGEGVAPDGGDLRQRRAPPQGPGQEEAGHEEKGYHYPRPTSRVAQPSGSVLFYRIRIQIILSDSDTEPNLCFYRKLSSEN